MSDFIAAEVIRERQARAHRGADLCRAAIAEVTTRRGLERAATESGPLSEADLILDLARRRAALERRTRTLAKENARA